MSGGRGAIFDERVREFISSARVGHLATAGRDGMPHNVPVCFCFDGERFYFAVDRKPKRRGGRALKRMRNIAQNPQVALVFDHYEEDWSTLAYVLIRGRAREVEDPREYASALRKLRDKYPQYRAMELTTAENPIVRIDADTVHSWGARFAPPAASRV